MNLSFDFGSELEAKTPALFDAVPLEQLVERLEAWMERSGSPIRAIHREPARDAVYAPVPAWVDSRLQQGLAACHIDQLYSHQADAIERVRAGENVVVVTPTASGKTLCFNVPVLNTLLEQPTARAVYLFPTKALAEDQRQELQQLAGACGASIACHTFDGDTPQDARRAIRERAHIVLTNPDMLHTGILPHHTKWARCFENLRYFVIDELHYYRGVYGSHLANVIRRVQRICRFYGSKPQFICCSATIANPGTLAQSIAAEPFAVVDRSGAPSGAKHFVFYNPPVVNRELGIRRSYLHEARRIAVELIRQRQQTLVFANSRLATEVLTTYLKAAFAHQPYSGDAIRGYRGGYLPRERREIERQLREGMLRAVVSTNALELGMDIGSLDAVVLAGYPGTIASTWQRAGRAGRRTGASLTVLVASSAPLDQFIVEHPEYFFGQTPEQAFVNPDNLEILLGHLKCAAFELPIQPDERFGSHPTERLCEFLEQELQVLHRSGGVWHWVSDSYPADAVSLRAISGDNFVVVDEAGDATIVGEVDFPTALTTLHPKAIYLHDSRQYQVERFDYEGRKAYVRPVDTDYFTDANVNTQVRELARFGEATVSAAPVALAAYGEVRVKTQVVGFKKIKFYTLENVGSGQLSLPEQEMHTTAFLLHFSAAWLAGLGLVSADAVQSALVATGNLMRTVGALLLMSDVRDLRVAITEAVVGLEIWEPNLYLYDAYPGGIGQSEPLFQQWRRLVAGAYELVCSCNCLAGCPSCAGAVGETGALAKEGAIRLLAALLGHFGENDAACLPEKHETGSTANELTIQS